MGIRTIRMDEDAERLLSPHCKRPQGCLFQATFKEGLKSASGELSNERKGAPYDIYKELDLVQAAIPWLHPATLKRG